MPTKPAQETAQDKGENKVQKQEKKKALQRDAQKSSKKKGPGSPNSFMPGGPNFLMNLATTIVVFLLLMSAYSVFTSHAEKVNTISLTQVANDVKAGKVEDISVE